MTDSIKKTKNKMNNKNKNKSIHKKMLVFMDNNLMKTIKISKDMTMSSIKKNSKNSKKSSVINKPKPKKTKEKN